MEQMSNDYTFGNTFNENLFTGRIALLDADYMKYIITDRIWKHYQDEGIYLDPIEVSKNWVEDWLLKISDPIIFCFSGKSSQTFRNHVSFEKEYKGNRKSTTDYRDYPNKINDMYKAVEYIQKNFVALIFNDLEADDILSALQDPDMTYIISNDKDLKQVPGMHYDFGTNSIYQISNEQALYFLSKQLLIGDTTDNIPGLPRIGEKTAETILNGIKPSNQLRVVINEYQTKFGIFKGTDMFVEMWNLIKMRENRGAHFQTKYKKMFDLKQLLLNNIERKQLEEKKNL